MTVKGRAYTRSFLCIAACSNFLVPWRAAPRHLTDYSASLWHGCCRNEDKDDLATPDLKYLAVPYLQGELAARGAATDMQVRSTPQLACMAQMQRALLILDTQSCTPLHVQERLIALHTSRQHHLR